MLILAENGHGLQVDYDELERWTPGRIPGSCLTLADAAHRIGSVGAGIHLS
jgi:hypothetical protein